MVHRVVDDIEEIVRAVRFDGWQATHPGSQRPSQRTHMRNPPHLQSTSGRTTATTMAPLYPFLKTIDFVWCLGPTLANMGPYSQATTEATKSIVDRRLCQLLTY